ncbi:hypothetical protein OSB04_012533 [Centaurea solstitialis]|uniref:Uncharacterized protein n=1 Tax=Centaurea solstitialis TaxID=347529 RepID=A0AA38TD95_9ASTR|nr:hypothetical protein OSB04_012533 [Centaurea solstitialis]
MGSNSNRLGVCETLETPRPPLRPAGKNNGTKCQSRTREVSSRYESPTTRRCPSPNTTRTDAITWTPVSNRSVSAERNRSGTPKSPSCPSAPFHDKSVGLELAARKATGSSMSVTFQSEAFSLSVSKREKPPRQALSDRILNSSSNGSQRQSSAASRSPLKGKNVIDRSENSKPTESLHGRLVDQHRWPSRKGSKVLNKSIDLSDKPMKTSRSVGASPLRRTLLPDYTSKPLEKYTSNPGRLPSSSADNRMEDAHYLRFLHNRQMQWRFVNARAESALKSWEATAEKYLSNVWRSTSELRDSVAAKRVDLNQLRLKLKLHAVVNQQMTQLDKWISIEREHNLSLSRAIEDLQSSTLRLPVTGGATVDIETVKSSLCSAIQVMQTMEPSLQSTLSVLEGLNQLVPELAGVAAQERALLDECEVLLVSAASLQVKEYSLCADLLQLKQALTPP